MAHPVLVGLALSAGLVWAEVARAQGPASGLKLSGPDYEGWRQYSAHCARCHGQDVVGNPVAADLLKSTAEGGPVAEKGAFVTVVRTGRPEHGMPAFGKQLTDEQIGEIHAYVKGRADGEIPAGRPQKAG